MQASSLSVCCWVSQMAWGVWKSLIYVGCPQEIWKHQETIAAAMKNHTLSFLWRGGRHLRLEDGGMISVHPYIEVFCLPWGLLCHCHSLQTLVISTAPLTTMHSWTAYMHSEALLFILWPWLSLLMIYFYLYKRAVKTKYFRRRTLYNCFDIVVYCFVFNSKILPLTY